MFYLERIDCGKWDRVTKKEFKSSEYAKDFLKGKYKTGRIWLPRRWEYRITDRHGSIYYMFDGVTANGRFKWAATTLELSYGNKE